MMTCQMQLETMLKKCSRKQKKLQKFTSSFCSFQSMKNTMELNDLLFKSFYYNTQFDRIRNWRPSKQIIFFKSYFFEIFFFHFFSNPVSLKYVRGFKTTNYRFKNHFLLIKLLNTLTLSDHFKICYQSTTLGTETQKKNIQHKLPYDNKIQRQDILTDLNEISNLQN